MNWTLALLLWAALTVGFALGWATRIWLARAQEELRYEEWQAGGPPR